MDAVEHGVGVEGISVEGEVKAVLDDEAFGFDLMRLHLCRDVDKGSLEFAGHFENGLMIGKVIFPIGPAIAGNISSLAVRAIVGRRFMLCDEGGLSPFAGHVAVDFPQVASELVHSHAGCATPGRHAGLVHAEGDQNQRWKQPADFTIQPGQGIACRGAIAATIINGEFSRPLFLEGERQLRGPTVEFAKGDTEGERITEADNSEGVFSHIFSAQFAASLQFRVNGMPGIPRARSSLETSDANDKHVGAAFQSAWLQETDGHVVATARLYHRSERLNNDVVNQIEYRAERLIQIQAADDRRS